MVLLVNDCQKVWWINQEWLEILVKSSNEPQEGSQYQDKRSGWPSVVKKCWLRLQIYAHTSLTGTQDHNVRTVQSCNFFSPLKKEAVRRAGHFVLACWTWRCCWWVARFDRPSRPQSAGRGLQAPFIMSAAGIMSHRTILFRSDTVTG
jgi:hypothetical protein